MLDFLREVWCSDNDEQLTYLLSWYSDVLKGKKNTNSILYVKSKEIVGRQWDKSEERLNLFDFQWHIESREYTGHVYVSELGK